jgi:Fibronectin type III domain
VRALGTGGDSAAVSSAPVVPATVPGAPTIASTTTGTGAVTVEWQAPGSNGRPILGYELSYGSTVKNVSASTRKATLSGLPRRTNLRVAVRARNEMGWGTYAYTPYVRTK